MWFVLVKIFGNLYIVKQIMHHDPFSVWLYVKWPEWFLSACVCLLLSQTPAPVNYWTVSSLNCRKHNALTFQQSLKHLLTCCRRPGSAGAWGTGQVALSKNCTFNKIFSILVKRCLRTWRPRSQVNIPENHISLVDANSHLPGEELGVLTGTFLSSFWTASSF